MTVAVWVDGDGCCRRSSLRPLPVDIDHAILIHANAPGDPKVWQFHWPTPTRVLNDSTLEVTLPLL